MCHWRVLWYLRLKHCQLLIVIAEQNKPERHFVKTHKKETGIGQSLKLAVRLKKVVSLLKSICWLMR